MPNRSSGSARRLHTQMVAPLVTAAGVVGAVAVLVALFGASAPVTVAAVAWLAVAVTLALLGFAAHTSRRVSARLSELTNGARRVAAGEFATTVSATGDDEITELATAFNSMTSSLKERTDSLTRKVMELTMLREMSRSMGTTLELDTLLDSVLESAMRMFRADAGYVVLRDRETQRLRLGAFHSVADASPRPDDQVLRSSLCEWVVREGRPLIVNPPSAQEPGDGPVDTVTGALSALSVPLVSSEGTIGALTVGSHDPSFRFGSDDVRLLSTVANQMTIAIDNVELFRSLQESYLATVRSLAAAVDAKDSYTRGHSDEVARHGLATAVRLGLSRDQLVAFEMAAYLHDIGKIGIPESILRKPGRLDAAEYAEMKHHSLIGANILSQVAFPWPIAPVVRHHHEWWDGSGYPAGLRGDEIPFLARILTVADAYEAMTSDRPYRGATTREAAIEELHRGAGSHFDPRVVEAFVVVVTEQGEGAEPARLAGEHEGWQHEEVRAVFVSLCDGMCAGFRRLGGPRLASTLEERLNAFFSERELPYFIASGHLAIDWNATVDRDGELQEMRAVVARLTELMAEAAGVGLVDHFHQQAIAGLSERLRALADELALYRGHASLR